VVIEVSDDGSGLDLHAIRSKAEEMGLVPRGAKPSERDVMSYILEPGFSTAAQVTQTAAAAWAWTWWRMKSSSWAARCA